MRTIIMMAVLLAMAVALTACEAAHPVTQQSLRFKCIFSGPDRGAGKEPVNCDPWVEESVCESYVNVARESYRNVDACMDACGETRNRLWQQHTTGAVCSGVINRGRNYCDRYCMGAYGTYQDDLDPGNLHRGKL